MSQENPPLLLTKRVTTFLASAFSSTHLHTLLLSTSGGKLLAHATRPPGRPVSELRAQSTVASGLIALHAASSSVLPDAFLAANSPLQSAPAPDSDSAATTLQGDEDEEGAAPNVARPAGITVQLSGGVLVVRQLRCGLLFVCIGPADAQQQQQQQQSQKDTSKGGEATTVNESLSATGSGSPDEGDSVLSAAASNISVASVRAQGVVVMRRQAEELARRLDEKLGTLRIPEDGVVGAD